MSNMTNNEYMRKEREEMDYPGTSNETWELLKKINAVYKDAYKAAKNAVYTSPERRRGTTFVLGRSKASRDALNAAKKAGTAAATAYANKIFKNRIFAYLMFTKKRKLGRNIDEQIVNKMKNHYNSKLYHNNFYPFISITLEINVQLFSTVFFSNILALTRVK